MKLAPASSGMGLAIDRGLEVEIKLVQRFDPGKPGLFEANLDAALEPAAPFGFERARQEAFEIEVAFGGLLADAVELGEPRQQDPLN